MHGQHERRSFGSKFIFGPVKVMAVIVAGIVIGIATVIAGVFFLLWLARYR